MKPYVLGCTRLKIVREGRVEKRERVGTVGVVTRSTDGSSEDLQEGTRN